MAPLSRSTLKNLAIAKVDDARILIENRRYSNAYYLFGYGIELGLKACIARHVVAETVPDKAVLNGFLDHQIGRLVGLAGLAEPLRTERLNPEFDIRWALVSEWSVDARYDMIDAVTAVAMADAVTHPNHGVLRWVQSHW